MTVNVLKYGLIGEYTEQAVFGSSEYINSSAGAADAGKPIVLDAAGLINSNMLNESGIDHGSIGGLGDDDHTQYSLVDGTRAYTGIVSYSTSPSFTGDNELVTKKYVDDQVTGSEWKDSVLDADLLTPPGSPSTGDRYLINGVGTGAWATHDNKIAEWNGTSWDFDIPTTGSHVSADDEPNGIYLYGGSSWSFKQYEVTTASTGLTKVGNDIRIDSGAAGDGLGFSAGILSVNVDDSSIEITTDTLNVKALGITNAMLAGSIADGKLSSDYIQTSEVDDTTIEFAGGSLNVKADGINDTHIDWGTGANEVNAGDLPIIDAGGYTAETTTEGAIQELFGLIGETGVNYTTDGTGVTKGDVIYVSANDTASTYSTLTADNKVIGLAAATVGAAATVKVLANDTVLTGVLTGATAGTVYYWDGSGFTSTFPSTAGQWAIQVGVAKNATDLHVECKTVKKNI